MYAKLRKQLRLKINILAEFTNTFLNECHSSCQIKTSSYTGESMRDVSEIQFLNKCDKD